MKKTLKITRLLILLLVMFSLVNINTKASEDNNQTLTTQITGDLTKDGEVDTSDVIYLLMHTYFKDQYPVTQDCDYNKDGEVNTEDVIYLLMHTYFKEQYPLDTHTHNIQHVEYQEATCSEDGNKEYYYCSECEKYFLDSELTKETTYKEVIIKAGHNYVNGVCDNCGLSAISNMVFELNSNKTEYIVKGLNNQQNVKEVIIPATYNGLPVTSIGDNAFWGCTSLTNIEIPDSVTSIGESVFADCNNLDKVYYEGTIENWCKITFSNDDSNPISYTKYFYIKNQENIYIPYTGNFVKGTTAYSFENGKRIDIVKSEIEFNGNTYYVINNEVQINVYIRIENNIYYYGNNGIKSNDSITNKEIADNNGNTYYVINNEVQINVYIRIENNIYYYGDNGIKNNDSITNKEITDNNGNTYYVINNEVQINVYIRIDNNIYYYGNNGIKSDDSITNKEITDNNGNTYYVINNEVQINVYIRIDNNIYYYGNNGTKSNDTLNNKKITDNSGNTYYVINNIIQVNIYVVIENHIYYFTNDGSMLANGTQDGYSFGADGTLIGTNITIKVNEILYEVDNGYVTPHTVCKDNNNDHKCDICDKTTSVCAKDDENANWIEEIKATCTEEGIKGHYHCSVCNKDFDINKQELTDLTIEVLGHNYVNGECTECGDIYKAYTYDSDNTNIIYFGSYPQSEVTDSSLKTILSNLSGTLPTSSNNYNWSSYGYYISGNKSNYMWYIDINYNNEKYRGVYFTSYRPTWITNSSSTNYSFQDDNGYYTSTVYWFKYEPIKWQILTKSNGKAFLLADIALDSQEYYVSRSSNNYAYSTIRTWLNETFYNTAFNELEKGIILTTTVDNSASSTGYSSNSYACNDTKDKVFLLSYKEVTTYLTSNTLRIRKTTDYAKSQGCYSSTDSSYLGNTSWWFRSPSKYYSYYARNFNYDGYIYYNYVPITYYGVVPALWIELECNHDLGEWIEEIEATCTEEGTKGHYRCSVCNTYFDINKQELTDLTIEVLGHNYVNGECTKCGDKKAYTYDSDNTNIIYFGSYPQSEVTDSSLKTILSNLSGTLPTSSNNYNWSSYGYYISGNKSNYMWYIDINYNNEKYRGVYFTSYRPYRTTYSSTTDDSYQDNNGYYTSTVYWFKYEPIKWQILTESNGKAFLLADIVLDSQEYYVSTKPFGTLMNVNNYEYSTIRAWLNETFYNTAFNELEKEIIQTTLVDNSVSSTGDIANSYVYNNTNDKVFLLSYQEVTTYLTSDALRQRKTTDYAKSQGSWASTKGSATWWLRSPYADYYHTSACVIPSDGSIITFVNKFPSDLVIQTNDGVVPALWITL